MDTFSSLMQVFHCDARSGLEIDPVPLVKLVVALYAYFCFLAYGFLCCGFYFTRGGVFQLLKLIR
jgi:hypothetical protein